MSTTYNGSKFTYVPAHDAEHDEWLGKDPTATKIVRDDEIHFAGNWMETLVGVDLEFYGAESQAFMVDGVVFEVLEDPDDGYRSHMAGVLARQPKDYSFYEKPFATVRIEKIDNEEREAGSVERMQDTNLSTSRTDTSGRSSEPSGTTITTQCSGFNTHQSKKVLKEGKDATR